MANVEMDQEWVKLISEAKGLGFKKEEISAFLKQESVEVTLEGNDGKQVLNKFRNIPINSGCNQLY